ncbi:MAG: hypothetical protein ACOY94_06020 [Bacillota bacterium]
MAEKVVSVERSIQKVGPHKFHVTVTRAWDPEAAERIKAGMLEYLFTVRSPQKLLARDKAMEGGNQSE